MRARVVAVAVGVVLGSVGCGGGGGDGGTSRRVLVLPHVLESRGEVSRVVLGDLDCDGVMDLLVHDASTASLTLLRATGLRESPTRPSTGSTKRLARGPRAYEPDDTLFVGDGATDFAVGDLDGDGVPDLVVARGTSNEFRVWLNKVLNGGTDRGRYHQWRWAVDLTLPDTTARVAIGDVTGDGKPDLVCLDTSKGQVHVLMQTSASPLAFAPYIDPPPVGACAGLALVDLDRDGRLDVVTNRPDADVVTVLYGGGPATWTLRESPTRHSTGRAMAVGDVDGDGWCDVVVLAEGGTSVVCLRQRSTEPRVFDDVESPLGLAVAEDGAPACVVSSGAVGSPRSGLAIDEPGVHVAGIAIGDPGVNGRRCTCPDGLLLLDLDRDGQLDCVCSPTAADPDTDPVVAYGLRESPTRFSLGSRLYRGLRESPSRPSTKRVCAACDLDQDGHLDLVGGDPDFDQLSLHYLDDGTPSGAPTFEEATREEPVSATARCVVADLDRDGIPDLVTATSKGLEIRWRDASGASSPPTVLAAAQACVDVAVGDVNNDGCPDVVVATPQACAALRRDPASPRGFLAPLVFPPSPGGNFRAIALADLDGDGVLDCVAIRESPTKASTCRGQGAGFFDVFTELDCAVPDPTGVAVGDLDGDGLDDLAVCGGTGCAVVRRAAPGFPLKWAPPEPLPNMAGVRVAVGDVNGDGRADVVACGDDGVEVAVQSPDEVGLFQPAYALSLEACGGLALCDVDRDGGLDVCFVEVKPGTLACVHGDPDFDLLRVVSLNGLPPGQPVLGISVAVGDLDGDGRAELVCTCPLGDGTSSCTLRTYADTP